MGTNVVAGHVHKQEAERARAQWQLHSPAEGAPLSGSRDLTVPASAGWVLQPVPRQPAAAPTGELITLTTCQDLFHSSDRSVAFGHLTATGRKR